MKLRCIVCGRYSKFTDLYYGACKRCKDNEDRFMKYKDLLIGEWYWISIKGGNEPECAKYEGFKTWCCIGRDWNLKDYHIDKIISHVKKPIEVITNET